MIIKLFEILNSFVSLFEELCRLRVVLLWDWLLRDFARLQVLYCLLFHRYSLDWVMVEFLDESLHVFNHLFDLFDDFLEKCQSFFLFGNFFNFFDLFWSLRLLDWLKNSWSMKLFIFGFFEMSLLDFMFFRRLDWVFVMMSILFNNLMNSLFKCLFLCLQLMQNLLNLFLQSFNDPCFLFFSGELRCLISDFKSTLSNFNYCILDLINFRIFFNFLCNILDYNFLNFLNLLLRNWFKVLNDLLSSILYNLICDYLNIFDDLFFRCTFQRSNFLNFLNILNLLSLLNLLHFLNNLNRFRRRLEFFDNFLYNWTLNLLLWFFVNKITITHESLFFLSIWLWITVAWSLPNKDFLSIFSLTDFLSNYSF